MARDKDVVKQKVMKLLSTHLTVEEFSMVKSITIDLSAKDKDEVKLKEKVFAEEYKKASEEKANKRKKFEMECLEELRIKLGLSMIKSNQLSISIAEFYHNNGYVTDKQALTIKTYHS